MNKMNAFQDRILFRSFTLIILLLVSSITFSADDDLPRIDSVVVPQSAMTGESFDLIVTASSKIGLKLVRVEFEEKTEVFVANSKKSFTFTAKLMSNKAGSKTIGIIPVDVRNKSGKTVTKKINIIAQIISIPTYTVKTTRTPIKTGTHKVDPDRKGAELIEPAKLVSLSLSADPNPVLVGAYSIVRIKTDMPAPREGFRFVVNITTPDGNPAYGFEQRRFDIKIEQGDRSASFKIKSSRPYPDAVFIILSHLDRQIKEKLRVLMPAEIKSLRIENEPDVDVLTLNPDSNKKCTVALDKHATPGGTIVKLKVEGPDAKYVNLVPSELTILEGKTSGNFSLQIDVQAAEYFVLSARTFSKEEVITININPFVQISSLSLIPIGMHRGETCKGIVKLTNPALKGGANLKIYKSDYGAQFVTIPDSLIIPEGKDKGQFNVVIAADAKPKSKFSILVYLSDKSKISQQYIISPFRITYFSINPDIMENRTSNINLLLDGPAPAGGLECLLKIMTPQPNSNWAYGFDKHMYRFTFQEGGNRITIPVITNREYPNGVDMIISCSSDDIYLQKHFDVASEQKIESFYITPQPILKGRTGLGTIILNRADLGGNPTTVTLTLLSEWAKPYLKFSKEVIIPIKQTTGNFTIEIDKEFSQNKFYLKAEILSGSSKSIEVKVGDL